MEKYKIKLFLLILTCVSLVIFTTTLRNQNFEEEMQLTPASVELKDLQVDETSKPNTQSYYSLSANTTNQEEVKFSTNIELSPIETIEFDSHINGFFFEGRSIENLSFKIEFNDGKITELVDVHESHDNYDSTSEAIIKISDPFFETEQIQKLYIFSNGYSDYELKLLRNDSSLATANSVSSAFKNRFFSSLGLEVILREQWGAPLDSGWEPTIAKVDKIVVHHTATGVDLGDPSNTVRSIYNYHFWRCSNNNGSFDPNRPDCDELSEVWNDIGYNYLIDPYGTIYEGRAGGNGVVGAHSIPNAGSIGISIIGNYTNSTPTFEAQESLKKLIGVLSRLNDITPNWQTNVYGHRNFMATQCPGNALYDHLPYITSDSVGYHSQNNTLNSSLDRSKNLLNNPNVAQIDGNVKLVITASSLSESDKNLLKSNYRGQINLNESFGLITVSVPQNLAVTFMTENYLVFPNARIEPDYIINSTN